MTKSIAGYLNIFAGWKLEEIDEKNSGHYKKALIKNLNRSNKNVKKAKIDQIKRSVYFQNISASFKSYWLPCTFSFVALFFLKKKTLYSIWVPT